MFDLFISSHPHILISLYPLYPRILISLCSSVIACVLTSLHPDILRFICSHLHPASSYPQVRVCLLVTSHPHIILSSGSCIWCACWYPHILTSSYPYVCVLRLLVGTLTSSHPHILMFVYSVCLLVSSQPHILIFLGSYTPGACWYPCILISSYLYVHVLWV